MAGEITVTNNLTIQKNSSDGTLVLQRYVSQPGGFKDSLTGYKGPSPGAITAAPTGTQVPFTELTRPTHCDLANLGRLDGAAPSADDYFEYGLFDTATNKFYPLGELGPGESTVFKFSRNLTDVFLGPGTGSSGAGNSVFMVVGHLVNIIARVNAFEK